VILRQHPPVEREPQAAAGRPPRVAAPGPLRPRRKHIAGLAGRRPASQLTLIRTFTSHNSMLRRQTACAQSLTSLQARQRLLTGTDGPQAISPGRMPPTESEHE
jgi:hypothetical protein